MAKGDFFRRNQDTFLPEFEGRLLAAGIDFGGRLDPEMGLALFNAFDKYSINEPQADFAFRNELAMGRNGPGALSPESAAYVQRIYQDARGGRAAPGAAAAMGDPGEPLRAARLAEREAARAARSSQTLGSVASAAPRPVATSHAARAPMEPDPWLSQGPAGAPSVARPVQSRGSLVPAVPLPPAATSAGMQVGVSAAPTTAPVMTAAASGMGNATYGYPTTDLSFFADRPAPDLGELTPFSVEENIQTQTGKRKGARRAARQARVAGRMGAKGAGAMRGLDNVVAGLGSWNLGLNPVIGKATANAQHALKGAPHAAAAVGKLGGLAKVAVPLGVGASAFAPVAFGAMDGYNTAGAGGAGIQGGAALVGGLLGMPFGPLGAGIGAMIGSGIGGGLTRGASAAALAADEGDTGLAGGIGEMAKAIGVESPHQAEARAIARMENSPAMQAIRQEEALRAQKARTQAMEALYMQSLLG